MSNTLDTLLPEIILQDNGTGKIEDFHKNSLLQLHYYRDAKPREKEVEQVLFIDYSFEDKTIKCYVLGLTEEKMYLGSFSTVMADFHFIKISDIKKIEVLATNAKPAAALLHDFNVRFTNAEKILDIIRKNIEGLLQ